MMSVLVFYVALCFPVSGHLECVDFEPMTWNVNLEDKEDVNVALSECELVEKSYISLPVIYKESDCYFK